MSRTWLSGVVLLLAGCSGPVNLATLPPGPTPGVGSSVASFGTVAVDESLLRYLPASIGAIDVAYSAEATQEVVADKTLMTAAASLAYGMAVDPSTGDLVVAAVVRLHDGVFNEAFYRNWRTTYDEASCAPAGGIGGHAEATIGARTVLIGTCNGGAHTYHVHLDGRGVLISATSVGPQRFGEQLVATLRP